MGHDVFISYSSKDKAVSDAACALLEQRGYRCWIAPRDILPGQEWGEAIIDGIRGARIFVLIFSSNANVSQQVRREVERAAGNGLPIVPFRIENVQPARSLEYFISNQHWLDALNPPMERHLDYLGDVVERLLTAPPAEAHVAAPPTPASHVSSRTRSSLWDRAVDNAFGLAAGLLILGILAYLGGARPFGSSPTADPAVSVENVSDNVLSMAENSTASPRLPPPAPVLRDENLIDFSSVPASNSIGQEIYADRYLGNSVVRTRIVETGGGGLVFMPSRSSRLDYLNVTGARRPLLVYFREIAAAWRPGDPPRPAPSQPVPNFVVLELENPVARVDVYVPAVRPTRNGPGFVIRAYDTSGEEIARETYTAVAGGNAASAQQLTLTGWAGRGIRRIRIECHDIDNGEYAFGVGFILERITIRRMSAPAN